MAIICNYPWHIYPSLCRGRVDMRLHAGAACRHTHIALQPDHCAGTNDVRDEVNNLRQF
jgi:hypothetical protein